MANKLQRVPLDVSIHWRYLHQDPGRDHTGSIQKQPSAGI